jgi:hypothetical protein
MLCGGGDGLVDHLLEWAGVEGSWDLTKLAGPAKWTWFYLYTILDLFSRYVVGWMVAAREAASLAERLLADTITSQQVPTGTLTVHADRGASMTAKPVAMLLADLGVTRSHARPHVPDDNPYSESQFKTLKHHPTFPDRFGCIQDARAFCQGFFGWYNHEHRHSGIGLLTPGRRPLRPRGADHRCQGRGAGRRLRRPSRAVCRQATPAASAAPAGMDQQAHRPIGAASAIPWLTCLTEVDRLRGGVDEPRGMLVRDQPGEGPGRGQAGEPVGVAEPAADLTGEDLAHPGHRQQDVVGVGVAVVVEDPLVKAGDLARELQGEAGFGGDVGG